jgi:hypothetical protein
MRTTILLAAALALAAPAAFAASFDDSPLAVDSQLSGPLAQLLGEPQTATCGGSAPATEACSDGTHLIATVPAGPLGVSHGFSQFSGYTGTLESKLTWHDATGLQSGQRVFRCDVTSGSISCHAGVGTFPANGADFVTHTCAS